MEPIEVLILEDDLILQEDLAEKLSDMGFRVSGRLDRGEDILPFLRQHQADVILMDIHLAGQWDGIETAAYVLEEFDIPIIYLTDYTDKKTFNKAKLTSPANFLPKPYNEAALERAIDLAFYNASHAGPPKKEIALKAADELYAIRGIFMIKCQQHYEKINVNDIVYMKADRAYSLLYTIHKKHHFTFSLNKLEEKICHGNLIRVSRSHIINVERVERMKGNTLCLSWQDNEVELTIGKTYKDDFIKRLRIIS